VPATAGLGTEALPGMRPLEVFLSFANLTMIIALVVVRTPQPWLRYLAPVPLIVFVVQAFVEGRRWQLFPAYLLSVVLCLAWLFKFFSKSRFASHHGARRLVSGVGLGLSALILITSIALPLVLPVFKFPQPSGPYKIGTVTYHWVDTSRSEIFTADPNDHRELMAQIWYPVNASTHSSRAPYLDRDPRPLTAKLGRLVGAPDYIFEQMKYVTTNAVLSELLANDTPHFPVLIFLEGLNGYRQMNTFQVEQLVSHGYIVVAIDQPYTAASVSFPDGDEASVVSLDQMKPLIHQSYAPSQRAPVLNGKVLDKGIIPYLSQDVVFTINQLTAINDSDPTGMFSGRLDLQRIGVFGVSLGGIVVGDACRIDPRLRACLVMDAPMTTDVAMAGLTQPAMWMTRDAETMRLERRRSGGWSELDISEHQTTMRAAFHNAHSQSYFVEVPGMFHVNLTDIPYWSPLCQRLGITGPIDKRRAHRIINDYSLAFFDKALRDMPSELLEGRSTRYPEVILNEGR
jgi:pimeloyl-ACP methyl ester carboxylesterase